MKINRAPAKVQSALLEAMGERQITVGLKRIISQTEIFKARQEISKIYVSDNLKDYVVNLVVATREAAKYDASLGIMGDRIGLILFGEYTYLQVPITFDTFSLSMMLNKAVAGMAGGPPLCADVAKKHLLAGDGFFLKLTPLHKQTHLKNLNLYILLTEKILEIDPEV